jgi:aspartyl-tRNA(Asn)/glutamyl-tRNA(Gln) amidotransferase subunit C
MARIDREEVKRVASLARLSVSDEEADRLAAELDSFLGYIETLRELDTSDIEPTSHPIPLPTPMREDRAEAPIDPELAIANAPEATEFAFLVPKVIDSETEG